MARLAPEGLLEWGSATAIAAVILVPLWIWSPVGWLNWTLTAIVAVFWAFVVQFFRDPERRPPADLRPGDFLSPADGVISALQTVESHEAVHGPALVIRIFLNVFNVHVNRVPCDADVIDAIHRDGAWLDARRPESAMVNESNLVRMRRWDGLPLGVRQVSGAIARRIICPLSGGESCSRGQRMGMIKFGSTTELILPDPDQVTVHVSLGQQVRGGRTILAHVDPASVD